MKKFLISFVLVLMATVIIFCGCDKGHNFPTPSNIDLNRKPLPEVKAILRGKWQLHYMQGGFCGTCKYDRFDEYYEFGANDGIRWTISKEVMSDTTITWIKQDWQAREVNVMEFYAKDDNIHHLSPDRITKDTLILYEPGPDGMNYYLTKVK